MLKSNNHRYLTHLSYICFLLVANCLSPQSYSDLRQRLRQQKKLQHITVSHTPPDMVSVFLLGTSAHVVTVRVSCLCRHVLICLDECWLCWAQFVAGISLTF